MINYHFLTGPFLVNLLLGLTVNSDFSLVSKTMLSLSY